MFPERRRERHGSGLEGEAGREGSKGKGLLGRGSTRAEGRWAFRRQTGKLLRRERGGGGSNQVQAGKEGGEKGREPESKLEMWPQT